MVFLTAPKKVFAVARQVVVARSTAGYVVGAKKVTIWTFLHGEAPFGTDPGMLLPGRGNFARLVVNNNLVL